MTLSSRGYGDDDFGGSTAYINLVATENFTNTEKDTAISFATTPNGATDRDERMRIDHNGNVGIGTENPQSALQVDGYVQLALTDGNIPPQADCDESSEYGRMMVDQINEDIYVCVVSGWKTIKGKKSKLNEVQ